VEEQKEKVSALTGPPEPEPKWDDDLWGITEDGEILWMNVGRAENIADGEA
jgi:hypothetical protein